MLDQLVKMDPEAKGFEDKANAFTRKGQQELFSSSTGSPGASITARTSNTTGELATEIVSKLKNSGENRWNINMPWLGGQAALSSPLFPKDSLSFRNAYRMFFDSRALRSAKDLIVAKNPDHNALQNLADRLNEYYVLKNYEFIKSNLEQLLPLWPDLKEQLLKLTEDNVAKKKIEDFFSKNNIQ